MICTLDALADIRKTSTSPARFLRAAEMPPLLRLWGNTVASASSQPTSQMASRPNRKAHCARGSEAAAARLQACGYSVSLCFRPPPRFASLQPKLAPDVRHDLAEGRILWVAEVVVPYDLLGMTQLG
jgi:hypothetical protein